MRKSIKLLSAILAVILLVAALATVLSATPSYVAPTAPTKLYGGDFEGAYPSGLNSSGGIVLTNPSFNGNGVGHYTNMVDGAMIQHTTKNIGTITVAYKFIADSDYATYDFDISADQYTNGTEMISPSEYAMLPASRQAEYTPSYTEMYFYLEVPRLYSSSHLWVKKINGTWCLSNSNGTQYVELPETAGAWTHVTYVISMDVRVSYNLNGTTNTVSYKEYSSLAGKENHTDVTAIYSSSLLIYVNGDFAIDLNWGVKDQTCPYDKFVYAGDTSTSKEGGVFKYIQVASGSDSSSRVKTPMSIMFDNIALHTYSDGYNGDLAKAVATRSTIRYCNDTIFNVNYPFPAGTDDAAVVTNPDGSQESYYLYEAALNATSEYCLLTLNKDATVPYKPEFPFYIQTNGYDFLLSSDSTFLLEEAGEDGLYLLREAAPADYGKVIWDEGGRFEATSTILGGFTPEYPKSLGTVKDGDSIMMVAGWSTVKGSATVEEIPTAVAGKTIRLYPVYVEILMAAVDEAGNVVKGYSAKEDIIEAVNSPIYGTTLVLYTDIELGEFDLATNAVPFNVTSDVTIDLNGHRLSRFFSTTTSTDKPTMFSVSTASKLNIYSSVAGAEILYAVYFNTESPVIGGGAIITNSANSTIVLGNGTQNLLINAPMLLHNTGGTASLTINGGSYFVNYLESDGVILVRGGNLNMTAKKATIGINYELDASNPLRKLGFSLFSAKTKDQKFNANIDGCTLIGTRLYYGFGADPSKPSVFNITNTNIIINNSYQCEGVVTNLGDEVKFNIDLATFKTNAGCTRLAEENSVKVSYKWYGSINFNEVDGKYVVDESSIEAPTSVTKTFTTVSAVYVNSKVGIIEWRDAFGNPIIKGYDDNGDPIYYEDTYARFGTKATFPGDTSVLFGAQVTDYTAKSFSYWKNVFGKNDLTVVGGINNKFVAVCDGDPIPHVTPAYNIATSSEFIIYFYLPINSEATINYVTIDGENVLGTDRMSEVRIGGKDYYRFYTLPDVCEVKPFNHQVSFTVNGQTHVQHFDLSFETYFISVLSSPSYSVIEKQLVATALNYCNQIYNYVNKGVTCPEYDAILETYDAYITTVTNTEIRNAAKERDMSAVKNTVTGAMFTINQGYRPMFGFTVAEGVDSVTFTNVTNRNGETITYVVTAEPGSNGNLLTYGGTIPVYDVCETITVIVGESTGTYNLASYIVDLQSLDLKLPSQIRDNNNAISLCKALYAYSKISLAYKLS